VGAEVEARGFQDGDGPGGGWGAKHEMSVNSLRGWASGHFRAVSFWDGT
jgi:hypothetical protein